MKESTTKKKFIAYDGEEFTIEWYYNDQMKSTALESFNKLSVEQRNKAYYLIQVLADAGAIKNKDKFNHESDQLILNGIGRAIIMTKSIKKAKSTFEEFMEAQTPAQRKQHEEGYIDLVLSELILAAMKEDDISVRKLAKIANVSPTIVQEMKSGDKTSFNTKSLFKVLKGLGYNIFLERNGIVTSLDIALR